MLEKEGIERNPLIQSNSKTLLLKMSSRALTQILKMVTHASATNDCHLGTLHLVIVLCRTHMNFLCDYNRNVDLF